MPNLLNKNKNLKLTGSWKSEVGILDQYGNLKSKQLHQHVYMYMVDN